jgi:hypothetical protein
MLVPILSSSAPVPGDRRPAVGIVQPGPLGLEILRAVRAYKALWVVHIDESDKRAYARVARRSCELIDRTRRLSRRILRNRSSGMPDILDQAIAAAWGANGYDIDVGAHVDRITWLAGIRPGDLDSDNTRAVPA